METKRPNGPILGIMSTLSSVALGLFVFVYFMVMSRLALGHFNTFETVSMSIMVIPLFLGIGSIIRRERMLFLSFFGMGIAIATLGILTLMLMLNGM